ncbi:MAG: hypothetical protein ACUVUE_05340 [Candidatus Bathycorpusculaceae bacterium]
MSEVLGSMIDFFLSNSEITLPVLLASLIGSSTWLLMSIKRYAPLTVGEAVSLWIIHQRESKCNARRWRKIVRKNRVVGFECGCGYRYVQKRPMI